MNAFLAITTDKDYNSDEYFMKLGKDGQIYHEADKSGFWEDYFVIRDNGVIHNARIKTAIELAWNSMNDTVTPDMRVLMNGSDSSTAQPQLTEIVRRAKELFPDLDLRLSTLEEYVKDFKDTADVNKLRVITGELRDGPAYKCSANALSTRPRIKILNKHAENMLFKIAEPMSCMEEKYNKPFLDKAINYLLLSHPHDSVNGVTQDKTADDTIYRLAQSLELSEAVANTACKNIVKNIDYSKYPNDAMIFTVFNTLPYSRNEILRLYIDFPQDMNVWDFDIFDGDKKLEKQIISRNEVTTPVSNLHTRPLPYLADRFEVLVKADGIPAMGYKTIYAVKKAELNRKMLFWHDMRKFNGKEIAKAPNLLENEFIKARVNSNGTLTVTDKENGRVYSNLNYFEETGDCGDYWIYYPPYHNKTYSSTGANADIWCEENTSLSATVCAKISMKVPAYAVGGESRIRGENRRSSEMTDIVIETKYTLKKGEKAVFVETTISNTAKDHRMKVVFETGIKTDIAKSAGHFYVDKRSTIPPKGEYYPEMQTLPKGYYTTLEDENGGFSFIDNCTCEYEADKNGRLSVSLFRGVKNIICTEFRSAGVFSHEDGGQSMGRLVFNYMLYPFAENNTALLAEKLSAPVKTVQTSKGTGKMPDTRSMLELPDSLVLTAMKKAENGGGYIIRLYNPTNTTICGSINTVFKNAVRLNMNEEKIGEFNFNNIEVPPYKIITIGVEK